MRIAQRAVFPLDLGLVFAVVACSDRTGQTRRNHFMPRLVAVILELIFKCLLGTICILLGPQLDGDYMKERVAADAMPENGVVIANRNVNRHSGTHARRTLRPEPG